MTMNDQDLHVVQSGMPEQTPDVDSTAKALDETLDALDNSSTWWVRLVFLNKRAMGDQLPWPFSLAFGPGNGNETWYVSAIPGIVIFALRYAGVPVPGPDPAALMDVLSACLFGILGALGVGLVVPERSLLHLMTKEDPRAVLDHVHPFVWAILVTIFAMCALPLRSAATWYVGAPPVWTSWAPTFVVYVFTFACWTTFQLAMVLVHNAATDILDASTGGDASD